MAVNSAEDLLPRNWLNICLPEGAQLNKDHVKSFINDPKTASIGDIATALLQYKDDLANCLHEVQLLNDFYSAIAKDNDFMQKLIQATKLAK